MSDSSDPIVEPDIIDIDPAPDADPSGEGASSREQETGGFRFDGLFDGEVFRRLKIEVDPDRVEESVDRLTEQVRRAVVRGRYTKVRILYRGQPLMRDLPLGVFVAAEAMSFWYAGLLRALVVNLGARAVLEVVFINDADEDVRRGCKAFETGDVPEAEEAFRAALEKEAGHQEALFRLGVLLKVKLQNEEAMERLEAAAGMEGPFQEQAREVLERMRRGPRTL